MSSVKNADIHPCPCCGAKAKRLATNRNWVTCSNTKCIVHNEDAYLHYKDWNSYFEDKVKQKEVIE